MITYTVVYFDAQGRSIRTASIQGQDDDDALERLARLRHPYALELWRSDRLVWRFEGSPLP